MDFVSFMGSQIIPVIIRFLQQLDDQCWLPLQSHFNKIICFDIQHCNPLYFKIQAEGLELITNVTQSTIATTFSGSLPAFIAMLFVKNRVQSGVHVKGDLDCAKALFDVWRHLDLDWEGYLAGFVGNEMAHIMIRGMEQSQKWFKETYQDRQADLGAYLQDEIQILPTQHEAEAFYKDIDQLRHDVERLEARVQILIAGNNRI